MQTDARLRQCSFWIRDTVLSSAVCLFCHISCTVSRPLAWFSRPLSVRGKVSTHLKGKPASPAAQVWGSPSLVSHTAALYYFVAFHSESPLFEDCGLGIFESVKLARSAFLETNLCNVFLPAWKSLLRRLLLVGWPYPFITNNNCRKR